MADYLPRGELLSERLAPALAVLAGLLSFGLLSSRRVLERGQGATSDLELAWDDVFRSLRGLSGNVIASGGVSIARSFAMVWDTLIRPSARVGAADVTLILARRSFPADQPTTVQRRANLGQLTLHIDPGSDLPLFAQLRRQLLEQVSSQELPPGSKLPPSVRRLASDLGLAPTRWREPIANWRPPGRRHTGP